MTTMISAHPRQILTSCNPGSRLPAILAPSDNCVPQVGQLVSPTLNLPVARPEMPTKPAFSLSEFSSGSLSHPQKSALPLGAACPISHPSVYASVARSRRHPGRALFTIGTVRCIHADRTSREWAGLATDLRRSVSLAPLAGPVLQVQASQPVPVKLGASIHPQLTPRRKGFPPGNQTG